MKNALLITFVFLLGTSYGQSFVDTKGKVHFFSKTPVEDIEATTLKAICALNVASNKVFVKIPIQSFEFPDKLMQEHFNENYLESEKIPYSTLDAAILEAIDYTKDGEYDVTLSGVLDLHGVKQKREVKGKLTIKNGVPVSATADFMVTLADHKIKVPKIVLMNIAESIKVDVSLVFSPYEKK